MAEPVITHMKPRGIYVVIGALGLAVAVLAVLYVAVSRQASTNQQTIRRLAGVVSAERQVAQRQQQLIRALQRQVRDCRHSRRTCGPPLTEAPTGRTQPGTTSRPTGSPSGARSSPSPTALPRPTRTLRPRPIPHPDHTPSPTPSPSATCSLAHPLRCLRGS